MLRPLKAINNIPFSFAIKAKHIKELLDIQKKKDVGSAIHL